MYGVLSGLAIGIFSYYILQRQHVHPDSVSQRSEPRIRKSVVGSFIMFVTFGAFDFFATAHSIASLYTRAFGDLGSLELTVTNANKPDGFNATSTIIWKYR